MLKLTQSCSGVDRFFMPRTYNIKLTRPIFETAIIRVEALDRANATQKALRMAACLDPRAWRTPTFDGSTYGIHVESVKDLKDGSINREIADERGEEHDAVKYVLLMANLTEPNGQIVPQPWMNTDDPINQSLYSIEWSAALILYDQPIRKLTQSENVIPFRRSSAKGSFKTEKANNQS